MAERTQSFVDVFFNYYDATTWIEKHFLEFVTEKEDWSIKELEIKLMPSGGYRAGVVFEHKQKELFTEPLFGAELDA